MSPVSNPLAFVHVDLDNIWALSACYGLAATREHANLVYDEAVPRLLGLLAESGLQGSLAVSTDSHIVTPLFFPGGDIGRLSVCGTVNDVAMSGAEPLFLTAGFILEEGLPVETLERVVTAMQAAAQEAGIQVVAGDTKVVERGKGDTAQSANTNAYYVGGTTRRCWTARSSTSSSWRPGVPTRENPGRRSSCRPTPSTTLTRASRCVPSRRLSSTRRCFVWPCRPAHGPASPRYRK